MQFQLLRWFRVHRVGSLVDKDNVGLTDLITADNAPYTFVPLQQQPTDGLQSAAILAAVSDLDKKIDEMATVSQPLSEAKLGFTRSLLQELNLKYKVCLLVDETGAGALDMYLWGEDEREDQGRPGCQAILEKKVQPFQVENDVPLGFFDVRNRTLPELKGGKYKSNGFPI